MANIQSQKKRNRQNEKRRLRNSQVKSSIRTAYKKVVTGLEDSSADADQVQEAYRKFVRTIDTAARKGIVHRNKASRKKSRLARRVNASISGQS